MEYMQSRQGILEKSREEFRAAGLRRILGRTPTPEEVSRYDFEFRQEVKRISKELEARARVPFKDLFRPITPIYD